MKPTSLERYKRKARLALRGMRGFELYRGPSVLTGEPVVCLVQLATENTKLSADKSAWQTWILRADIEPADAYQNGAGDESICGRCFWRARPGEKAGPCYVMRYVITAVYKSWKRENYLSLQELADRIDPTLSHRRILEIVGALAGSVRLGAYGDPLAMPIGPQQALLRHVATTQAFTHSWADERATDKAAWKNIAMASCETPAQVIEAMRAGWRTYTAYPQELTRAQAIAAIRKTAELMIAEKPALAYCPAAVKGSGITCDTCPIQCDGQAYAASVGPTARRPLHVINAIHGARSIMARYNSRGLLNEWRAAL